VSFTTTDFVKVFPGHNTTPNDWILIAEFYVTTSGDSLPLIPPAVDQFSLPLQTAFWYEGARGRQYVFHAAILRQ
jgi:hypothetical protein